MAGRRASTVHAARAVATAALGAVLLGPPRVARAQDRPRAPAIFFGTTLGAGLVWIDHPQLQARGPAGVVWDVVFGWAVSPRWTLAVMLTSWQDSALGEPVHLHTFAPRVEWTPSGGDGLYLALGVGMGMTDGDVAKRAGLGASLTAGYRVPLYAWVTLAVEGGALGHAYTDGTAVQPFVALHLRFYGSVGP